MCSAAIAAMRWADAVLKESIGQLRLHHLTSTYSVLVNESTMQAIERGLRAETVDAPVRSFIEKLVKRGLVVEGAWSPIERRVGHDLVSVELEPVGACNLRCRHCFVDFSGDRMTDEVAERSLWGARALGAVEVTLNGGEPLLHKRSLEWIDAVRKLGMRALLFTNATRVTDDVADRLHAAKVARVTVSLDGFRTEHDALRGDGSFDLAVTGVRRLTERGVSVFTTTVAHPGNMDTLSELQAFLREKLGVAGCRTSTVAPMGRALEHPELLLDPMGFRAIYGTAADDCGSGAWEEGPLPCRAGLDKAYVSAAGRVYACHLFDLAGSPLGDLHTETLSEVLAGASGHASCRLEPEVLSECSQCSVVHICRGGCRARAWVMRGRTGVDPVSCAKHGLIQINPRSEPSC